MKYKFTKRPAVSFLTAVGIISLICWDLASSLKYAQAEGTYRYESEFDAVTAATTKVAIVPSDFSELSDPVPRTVDPTYEQIEDMVRKAVELQGGLDWVISAGDKVLIKVNLVGGNSPSGQGENTDVRVVKALVRIIDEHTAGDVEIVIAEGTARTNDEIDEAGTVWDNSGYQDLLTDPYLSGINFRLFNLNQTYEQTLEITLGDKATAAPHDGRYHVHEEEIDADVFITVPVLKIHDTGITCALKNQIGTAPGCYYGYNKMQGSEYYSGLVHDVAHRRWTTEEIVDLCAIADIDFVVVDAIMCLEKYKNYDGTNQVRFNTIVATSDPVAADHICARLFCLNPDDIAHITLAEKTGLGTNNPENITITGASVDEVKKQVKKNSTQNGRFGQSNRTWLLSEYFTSTDMEAEHIPGEDTIEPVAGINGWSAPVYFFDDRIDLLSFYSGLEDIITYAFTSFTAPANQQAELWLGTHEDIRVFLNSEEVYSFAGINVYGDDDLYTEIIDITVREGINSLMVKTLNKYNDYSFALNICEVEENANYSGNRLPGLKFYIQPPDTTIVDPPEYLETLTENSLRCYPNPVHDIAVIEFYIPDRVHSSVDIYDLSGTNIMRLADHIYDPGMQRCVWNVDEQSPGIKKGIYICTLRTKNYSYSIRLLVQ